MPSWAASLKWPVPVFFDGSGVLGMFKDALRRFAVAFGHP
jgi:hypothetical protein